MMTGAVVSLLLCTQAAMAIDLNVDDPSTSPIALPTLPIAYHAATRRLPPSPISPSPASFLPLSN